MKILLVHDYANLQGGAESGIKHLWEALRRRGHDVRLFTTTATPPELSPDYQCFGTVSRWRTLLQTANPWAATRLRQVLDAFRPDVVHVKIFLTQLSPLILPALRGYPSIYHAVWSRAVCPTGTKLLPNQAICTDSPGWVCRRSGCLPWRDFLPLQIQMAMLRRWRDCFSTIVANSEATRRRLAEEGFEPIEVIYNGIPEVPPRGSLRDPPTAVFAGRLVPEKGTSLLLRAFARVVRVMPDARLVIAGDGPERTRLEHLLRELSIEREVSMVGRLSPDDMERRFRQGWLQAVPSVWEEPFGLVAAEAQMRGTAVVATDAGGLSEIVSDESTGLLVPVGEEEALAGAMTRLLTSRDLAEEMGRRGRLRALEHFHLRGFVAAFEDLYARLQKSRL